MIRSIKFIWLLTFLISGRGTYVPAVSLTDQTPYDTGQFVNTVAGSVSCELKLALVDAARQSPWLNTWSAKIALTLTIDEKSAINPGLGILDPPSFILNIGGSLSGEANRVVVVTWYLIFDDLLRARPDDTPCHKDGSLFINGDLKIREGLFAGLLVGRNNTDVASSPYITGGPLDTITHHVYFEIDTTGNLTPSWKYTNVTANSSGNFLTGMRTRRDDLIITMGPTETTSAGRTLKRLVRPGNDVNNQFYIEQIGQAVSNGFRNRE